MGPLFRTAGHTVRTQYGVTASAGQRRGDVEIRRYLRDQDGSRSLVFDLSIAHDRFGSSSHVQQNGTLSHPQHLDGPMRVAAQRKINAYRQQYAENKNIFFPRDHEHPPACTASFCVFFFYRPTVGLRWPSRRVECVQCVRRTSDGRSSSSSIQGRHELARVPMMKGCSFASGQYTQPSISGTLTWERLRKYLAKCGAKHLQRNSCPSSSSTHAESHLGGQEKEAGWVIWQPCVCACVQRWCVREARAGADGQRCSTAVSPRKTRCERRDNC